MQSRKRRIVIRSILIAGAVLVLGLAAAVSFPHALRPAHPDAIAVQAQVTTTPMSLTHGKDGPVGRSTRVWGFSRLNWTNVSTGKTTWGSWQHASPYGNGRPVYLDRTDDSDEWMEVNPFGTCIAPYSGEKHTGSILKNAMCS